MLQNIGSETKHGEDNFGQERKRYNIEKKTATVFQGSDTPSELYSHTSMMITERFSKKRNQGAHLQQRLNNIYRNLCLSYTAYCINSEASWISRSKFYTNIHYCKYITSFSTHFYIKELLSQLPLVNCDNYYISLVSPVEILHIIRF